MSRRLPVWASPHVLYALSFTAGSLFGAVVRVSDDGEPWKVAAVASWCAVVWLGAAVADMRLARHLADIGRAA